MYVRLTQDNELIVTFYEDDSDFNGNDFDYTFRFDAENTAALLELMGVERDSWSVQKWLEANVKSRKTGWDFEDFCIGHNISGTRTVHEDYPGGIHREETFCSEEGRD